MSEQATDMLSVSERVLATEEPCIVKTKQMMAGVEGVVSLAQGVVHWAPPDAAVAAAVEFTQTNAAHSYGPAEGMPELRAALREKLQRENGLEGYDVMVTAGANQAFVNVLLTLTDASDTVVLFKPYYFNHLMAVQMTGGSRTIAYGPPDAATLKPDLDWLESQLRGPSPPKMVVIVNPANPAGFLLTRAEAERAQRACAAAGAWLVMDNTYEHFTYDAARHVTLGAPNVVNIFSFSKAYGMMGWRVGYVAYPTEPIGDLSLGAEMLKVQDTIPICATQVSQVVALEALRQGRGWVEERVAGLRANRELVLDALSVLGPGKVRAGDAAIYLFAELPAGTDDEALVKELIQRYGVTTIPGASCGCPGYIRVAYANVETDACREACARLKQGLSELLMGGAQ